MRIGLISDTHIPEAGPQLPPQVYRALQGVDLILHAGDMHIIDVLDWLEEVAPVMAARGNGDYPPKLGYSASPSRPGVPDDPRVRESHVLRVDGLTIGLTHGFPELDEMDEGRLGPLMDLKFGGPVDVIVCGDTHIERVMEWDGILMVNAGSPTLPHQFHRLGHVALLDTDHGRPHARIVSLKDVPV
ncbi:MAG: metallophosphoesterase family protein [Chloroflexi bacterium]|nr:metallophosphoesterase family protein [Chloroflexota bacterium]